MEKREAQERAIRLTASDERGEDGRMDVEGQVHKCPQCGHEMPMDEVLARAGEHAERLTEGDKSGLEGAHMDREGELG